jgi:hypothetical protein
MGVFLLRNVRRVKETSLKISAGEHHQMNRKY